MTGTSVEVWVAEARRYLGMWGWYFLRRPRDFGTALIPPWDAALFESDMRLRALFGKEWPSRWAGPEVTALRPSEQNDALALLYWASMLTHQEKWEEVRAALRSIVDALPAGSVHASATRDLILQLWAPALSTDELMVECRSRCETALRQYADLPWSPQVLFAAEAAMGLLDDHQQRSLSAKIHLEKAAILRHQIIRLTDSPCWSVIGRIELALGQMAHEQSQFEKAISLLEAASIHLDVDEQPSGLDWLASAYLGVSSYRRAMRAAQRGLRLRSAVHTRDSLDDALRSHLADALIGLGRYEEAKSQLEQVSTAGADPVRQARASRILGRLSGRKS